MIFLWLLTVVVGLVAAIIGVLLVLLAVPVGVRVTRTAGSERVMVKAHWLWGVVRISLTGRKRNSHGAQTRRGRRAIGRQKKRQHDPDDRSRQPALKDIPVIVRTIAKLLNRILHRLKVAADGDMHIGLSDPADTGIFWGVSAPYLLRFTERVGLRVQPSFGGAEFAFTGRAAVEVVPVTVVVPVLRFVLSRNGRTVVRILRGRA